jgi:hypothetical protein
MSRALSQYTTSAHPSPQPDPQSGQPPMVNGSWDTGVFGVSFWGVNGFCPCTHYIQKDRLKLRLEIKHPTSPTSIRSIPSQPKLIEIARGISKMKNLRGIPRGGLYCRKCADLTQALQRACGSLTPMLVKYSKASHLLIFNPNFQI